MKRFIVCAVVLALLAPLSVNAIEGGERVTIGTGSPTGVYYQLSNALKKIVQRQDKAQNYIITPLPSGGAVDNLNGVLDGRYDFAIVQADKLYQAANGRGDWATAGPQSQLREVMALQLEYLTLIATDASGIRTLQDLRGKKIDIGPPGSGIRQNAEGVLQMTGLWDGVEISEKDPVAAMGDLIKEDIDAEFFMVGHPNIAVREISSNVPARLIPIEDARLSALIEKYPFLSHENIPVIFYPKLVNAAAGDVPTVAARAVLVTRAEQSEDIVHAIVKAVLADFDYFRKLHPSLAELSVEKCSKQVVVPLHPGSERAFREAGLVVK